MKAHGHRVAECPRISVVLPTHNGKKYISQAIESVISQTCQDWELIIVNDASTDDTPTRIDWWAQQDDRIRAVHLERNRTLPGALNEGFSRARGEYHTWISDDNRYHPDAFARMHEALEKDRESALLYAGHQTVNEFGRPMGKPGIGSHEELWRGNRIGACFLYRREVFDTLGGYDEQLFGAEDYDFWLRAALHFQFRRLPEPLYSYRLHRGSLTFRRHRLVVQNVEKALRRWLAQMAWDDDTERTRAYVEWGVRCLAADTWEDVFEPWLQNAGWLSPDMAHRIRSEVLGRIAGLARGARCARHWDDFERYLRYVREYSHDGEATQTSGVICFPRWLYRTKDLLCAIGDALHPFNLRGRLLRRS